MIQAISIKNFQSHPETILELSPGVNVMVGASDSGKTALIRALKWLMTNRPSGDSFRSNWGGDTEVTVQVDGNEITRTKTKTENLYQLEDILFKAFGSDVPQEVLDLLNMNEINSQFQLDSPFLLTSSPGEVASHFNKVANLDKIDSSIKMVQSWIRKLEQDIAGDERQLNNWEEEAKHYDHLDKVEMDLEVLERMGEQLQGKHGNREKMKYLIAQIKQVEEKIEEQSGLFQHEKAVCILIKQLEDRNQQQYYYQQLNQYLMELEAVEDKIEDLNHTINLESDVLKLLDLINQEQKMKQQLQKLESMVNEIIDFDTRIKETKEKHQRWHDEFDKAFPDQCPLCGSPKKLK